jgi:hypothetical protein
MSRILSMRNKHLASGLRTALEAIDAAPAAAEPVADPVVTPAAPALEAVPVVTPAADPAAVAALEAAPPEVTPVVAVVPALEADQVPADVVPPAEVTPPAAEAPAAEAPAPAPAPAASEDPPAAPMVGDPETIIEFADEPVCSELDQQHADLHEAARDVDDAHEAIDELEGSYTGLEAMALDIETSLKDGSGGLTRREAQAYTHAAGFHGERLGLRKSILPSLEHFGGSTTREQATTVSLEAMNATLEKILNAIKEAYALVLAAIKAFFARLFDVAPRILSAANSLKAKVGELKSDNGGEIEFGSIAAKIAIGGQVGDVPVGATNVVELFSRMGSHYVDTAPMKLTTADLSKATLATDEGRTALVSKLVAESKSAAKPIEGFPTHTSDNNSTTYKSVELPGGTQFVMSYNLASESDSVPAALAAALSGGTLRLQAVENAATPDPAMKIPALKIDAMKSVLEDVIKLATMVNAVKAKIAFLEGHEGTGATLAKELADAGEDVDQAACTAAIRAYGRHDANAARAPYQIYKYGADVMKSYLILVDRSVKAHGVAHTAVAPAAPEADKAAADKAAADKAAAAPAPAPAAAPAPAPAAAAA